MMLVVTFVSFLIHLYSAEFMSEDEGYSRYFAYMNLFVASMLVLVLADNLLFLYLGWEGVGLCSYLLIGFWYRDSANGLAARKAFIVTRVGDTAMAIGLFILFTNLGTLEIQPLMQRATEHWPVGSGLADRRGGAVARRCRRQVGATAAADLAARRHGRPDAGQRPHSCRNHGDGRRLSHRPHPCALPARAARPHRRRGDRRADFASRLPSARSIRTTSSASSPTRRSARSATCSWRSGLAPGRPPSSIS